MKGGRYMGLEQYFPIWDKLTADEQALLLSTAIFRKAPKGTLLHSGSADCVGLFVMYSGQLRAFILSDEGRELTLYRLCERDVCLFSASCLLQGVQFDIIIEAEKDSELWIIPSDVYKKLMERSVKISNFTNELMALRFSEVMWLIEQVMWKSFDKRLAAFLLDESALNGDSTLHITHEKIASHMGTAREVVTRMLRYFQSEGMVSLSRGTIKLTNQERLRALAE